MATRTVTKVDKTGRVYLPGALRKAAGLGTNTLLEIKTRKGEVILKKRLGNVATSSRGMFKLKVRVRDVDAAITRLSADEAKQELHAIRRR